MPDSPMEHDGRPPSADTRSVAARPLSILVLVLALGMLTVGIARAVDIGDSGAPSAAAKSVHNQHAGKAAKEGGGAKEGEHDKHALTGPPPAALDNGSYVLRMDDQVARVGADRFRFQIINAKSGKPVTAFQEDLTKKLHLIVVREDLTGFQHVHPRLAKNGEWIVEEAVLLRPGPWRFIADFIPVGGSRAVLATSIHASGGPYRVSQPKESTSVGEHRWRTNVGSYEVTLEAEGYEGGGEGELTFAVRREGKPVTDLQPYLGSRGHTVLLRWGDVAYVHVHPIDEKTPPGEIDFAITYPRNPPLKVFFQFRHQGVVRTAVFGLPVPEHK